MKNILLLLLLFSLQAYGWDETCRMEDSSLIIIKESEASTIIVNNKYKAWNNESYSFTKKGMDGLLANVIIYKNKAYSYKLSHFEPTNYTGILVENIYGKKLYGICADESWFEINRVYNKSTYKNWFYDK